RSGHLKADVDAVGAAPDHLELFGGGADLVEVVEHIPLVAAGLADGHVGVVALVRLGGVDPGLDGLSAATAGGQLRPAGTVGGGGFSCFLRVQADLDVGGEWPARRVRADAQIVGCL